LNYQSANLKLPDVSMRQKFSHEYPNFIPVKLFGIGVAVCTLLFWFLGFYSSGSGKWVAIVVPLLMGLGASYYSVQFYDVALMRTLFISHVLEERKN
jgi:hypothetical protein